MLMQTLRVRVSSRDALSARSTWIQGNGPPGRTKVPRGRGVWQRRYRAATQPQEVAEIVGIAEATAKTRMFYARRKLAELVAAA